MTHLSKYFIGPVRPLWTAAALVPLLGACVTYVQPAGSPPPQTEYADEAPEAAPAVPASTPPPPLPVYEQPPLPEPGYMWTPGFWQYGPAGYFWVPGTWVMPPRVGVLWTPGYWGFAAGGLYVFHAGYWGPHVGFYGGVNYGCGYGGQGYHGGRWVNNNFAYNTSVTNVNTTIVHNTYNETVINNTTINRVSYNGGAGGVHAVATPADTAAMRERHVSLTAAQAQHFQAASQDRALQANVNQGRPPVAATPHPGAFNASGVVPAHGAGSPAYGAVPAAPAAAAGAAGAAPHADPPAAAAPASSSPYAHSGAPMHSAPRANTTNAGAPGGSVAPAYTPGAHGVPHTGSPQAMNTAATHGNGATTGTAAAPAPAQPQSKPHVVTTDKPKHVPEAGSVGNEKRDQK